MRALFSSLVCSLLVVFISACGGGNSGEPKTPPPLASFTVSLNPGTLTLPQGGASQNLQIQVTGQNGFSGSVALTPDSLPPGVTVSPSSLSLSPGVPGTFTFTASRTAIVEQAAIQIDGTSGALTANASLQFTVNGSQVPDPYHLIGGEFSHGFYDQARQLLFIANTALNEIDVLSGTDLSVQARVAAPQPWGMDQMADGNTLVIGTVAQQIVTLNEDTLVLTSHPVPQFATEVGLAYPNVIALANGKVFIIGQQVGIDSSDILDGGQYLIEWDSNTNAFQIAEPKAGDPFLFEVDSLARSADHKWAIFSADKFYLYSSDDDTFTTVPLSTVNPPQDQYNVTGYAMNADGSKIGVTSGLQTTFLDRSFNVLGITAIPYSFPHARTYVTFTPDGTKLLLQYSLPLAIEELDTTNYTALGYFSGAMAAEDNDERLLAVDASGRAFAGISGGVRVIDTAGPIIPNPEEQDPLAGTFCGPPLLTAAPLNSSLSTTVIHYGSYAGSTYYFGGQPALSLPGSNQIQIPASSVAGPVDLECIGSDNSTALDAQIFSYGVDPIGLSANLVPPSGNVSASLYGFGFSSTPSVSIGGQSTTTSSVSFYYLSSLDRAVITVPAGTPRTSSDLSISSENGSGSLAQAFTYIPSATIVPASGLLQVLYDTHRNLLYALESSQIDILDPTSLQWQTPIPLPAAGNSGAYNAMAISPDGTFLAAASPNGFLAIVNPDNPAQASSIATNSTPSDQTGSIAITKNNIAVVTGSPNVRVNLSTRQVTPFYGLAGDLIRASADGSHLYGVDLNISSGQVYSIDPTTFSVKKPLGFADDFWSDLAVTNNGSQFAAILGAPFAAGVIVGVYSDDLHLLNYNVWPSTSLPDTPQVLGATFSPGGKVIVAPLQDSIEFWDVASDTLRARLLTPESLSAIVYPVGAVAPQIALDTAGQNIFAISASGLTVMTLAEPIDNLPANVWTHRAVFSKPASAFSGSKRRRMAAMRSLLTLPKQKSTRPSHPLRSNAN